MHDDHPLRRLDRAVLRADLGHQDEPSASTMDPADGGDDGCGEDANDDDDHSEHDLPMMLNRHRRGLSRCMTAAVILCKVK